MSAVAALALREAIIPLQTTIKHDDLETVKVEHTWTTGTTDANRRERSAKLWLPVCDDPSKKELFFYVIDQFYDAADNDRLHLSQGPDHYTKFRLVLQGSL